MWCTGFVLAAEQEKAFITKDFVKPTAVGRVFLNGTSYHPTSTFKSILKGECLRMRRLNERNEDFHTSLQRLKNKALMSSFPKKLTARIIDNASSWEDRFPQNRSTTESNNVKILTHGLQIIRNYSN